jgi:hypothetical protein
MTCEWEWYHVSEGVVCHWTAARRRVPVEMLDGHTELMCEVHTTALAVLSHYMAYLQTYASYETINIPNLAHPSFNEYATTVRMLWWFLCEDIRTTSEDYYVRPGSDKRIFDLEGDRKFNFRLAAGLGKIVGHLIYNIRVFQRTACVVCKNEVCR